MKKKLDIYDWLTALCCVSLICWAGAHFAGCTTTKAPDGTTTKQIDKEAVAQSVAIAIEILHDPVVSNAVWQAVNKK